MHVKTAKDLRAMEMTQLSEEMYHHLLDSGILYVYFPEATGIYGDDMSRIDNIGQNGNNGEHYDENPDGTGWPHINSDSYSDKVKKVVEDIYNPPKDGMFIDDYEPSDPVSPNHYQLGNTGVEAIDIIEASLTKIEFIGYLRGNILKYQLRANKKNGLEDLQKADMYSGWLIEALEGE